jgi:Zn-dependent M28 family amino/carboxypeptidase
MRRAGAALVLAAAVATACGGSGGAVERAAPGAARPQQSQQGPGPITAAGVREHLDALQRIARRHGGHRAAGTAGERESADYIAGKLRAAGWTVRFEAVRFPFFEQRRRPRITGLREGDDFRVLEYSGPGSVRARVRRAAGRGCDTAAFGGVQRGEIALVDRGTCTFRRKALNAQRAGAAALLIADDAPSPFPGTLGEPEGVDIPVVGLTSRAAARVTGRTVGVRVDAVSENRPTRDVIAQTPGTAPDAKVVMAGGHYDSVREGPGINDNGSGVAALLEVAERLAGRPGLRLGFWAAEELGLHGSRAYVRGLDRAARDRLLAYVNLDMVGSPRPLATVYDTDDRVERVLRRALSGRERETSLGGASDHAPFARAGVPVGGYFTGASRRRDPCYHRACDTTRNVDAAMLVRMARATQRALPALQDELG